MKKIITKLLSVILLIIVIYIGIKGNFTSSSNIIFDKNIAFERNDSRGQVERIFFYTSNEMIYSKNLKGGWDIALFSIKSREATHYFSGIYNIGTFPFGLRFYNSSINVGEIETKMINSIRNIDKSTFNEIGSKNTFNIVIYENRLKIDGDNYNKIEFSEEEFIQLKETILKSP